MTYKWSLGKGEALPPWQSQPASTEKDAIASEAVPVAFTIRPGCASVQQTVQRDRPHSISLSRAMALLKFFRAGNGFHPIRE